MENVEIPFLSLWISKFWGGWGGGEEDALRPPYKLLKGLTIEASKQVYTSLLQPLYDYADFPWGKSQRDVAKSILPYNFYFSSLSTHFYIVLARFLRGTQATSIFGKYLFGRRCEI